MDQTDKRFLKPGSPFITSALIYKRSQNVKVTNPEDMPIVALPVGTFGRLHSERNGTFCVWLLCEKNMATIIVEVPLQMMGLLFKQHHHRIFPHFA
jgi:hypothetical protein